MLSGGVFLIATAAIVPPWLELDRTRDQLLLMQEQAAALAERSDRYQSFLVQLDRNDPALLERLAFTQLRLQPAGVHSIETDGGALEAPADVAAWLDVPLPDPSRLEPTDAPPSTRMQRLIAGPTRYGVLAAGAIFAVCGVCWGRGRPEPGPLSARAAGRSPKSEEREARAANAAEEITGQIAPPGGPYALPAPAGTRRAG